jgi:hypothetical protein
MIQAKLSVGPVDDPHEREADRISRLVAGSAAGTAQRAPEAIGQVHPSAGGAADPAVEQAIGRARGAGRGRPVPAGVRERMERVSGADLGGVRVHATAEADRLTDALGARAFTVGADVFVRRSEYRPGSAGGDALLGHELTHVVQQGAAGVTAVQRYVDIDTNDRAYPELPKGLDFIHQYEKDGSFYRHTPAVEGTGTNVRAWLRFSGRAPIRFSDDFELAIERGREAKNFFATRERITESNGVLDRSQGNVELVTTGRHFTMECLLEDPDGGPGEVQRVELYEVQAGNRWTGQAGWRELRTPQRCNEMITFVLGRTVPDAKGDWYEHVAKVLDRVVAATSPAPAVPRFGFLRRRRVVPVEGSYAERVRAIFAGPAVAATAPARTRFGLRPRRASLDMDALDAAFAARRELVGRESSVDAKLRQLNALAAEMVRELRRLGKQRPAAVSAVLAELALNEFVAPRIGWGLSAAGVGTLEEDTTGKFPYHYASVVAASGGDFVTIENYARQDPVVGVTTASSGDPLHFFYMYSTDPEQETWHRKQSTSGGFAGWVLSASWNQVG